MSVIHFVDKNILFDMNDVCFMRPVKKEDETDVYEIEVKFKSLNEHLIVFSGTQEECDEKIEKVAESTVDIVSEEPTIQWLLWDVLSDSL